MALIDVSELMTDPDFVDQISVIHRAPVVNSLGENSLVETFQDTIGSVQPASGATLKRLPEGLRTENVNSFWIKGQIISDGKNQYPDLLVFRGHTYEIQLVTDWSNFGAGYCEGTAIRRKISL